MATWIFASGNFGAYLENAIYKFGDPKAVQEEK